MRACFASFVFASTLLGVVSCSSGSFNVAAPGDAGTDGPDPCAAVDGVAKFCVTVKRVATHPTYDASSGATELGIDGKGELDLLLFTKDPVKNPDAAPAFTIQYASGQAIDIDQDIPVTISSSAPEGTYWFAAVFKDDTTTARDPTTGRGTLAGDFITLPTIAPDLTEQFPTATLSNGKTAQQEVSLSPIRRVLADLRPTLALEGLQKANSAIHGDGPVAFVILDGAVDSTTPPPTIYDLTYVSCVSLFAPETDPSKSYPIVVPFYTIANGKHSLIAALYDYPTDQFNGKGVIFSPIHDTPGDKVASVDLSDSSWSTVAEVPMASVPNPYTTADAPSPDPYVCN